MTTMTTTAEQKRAWYAKNREKIAKRRKELQKEKYWQGKKTYCADNWTPRHINFLLSLEDGGEDGEE